MNVDRIRSCVPARTLDPPYTTGGRGDPVHQFKVAMPEADLSSLVHSGRRRCLICCSAGQMGMASNPKHPPPAGTGGRPGAHVVATCGRRPPGLRCPPGGLSLALSCLLARALMSSCSPAPRPAASRGWTGGAERAAVRAGPGRSGSRVPHARAPFAIARVTSQNRHGLSPSAYTYGARGTGQDVHCPCPAVRPRTRRGAALHCGTAASHACGGCGRAALILFF